MLNGNEQLYRYMSVRPRRYACRCVLYGCVRSQARVMRDRRDVTSHPRGQSKEYGFVTFTQHEASLAALRNINNNPEIFTASRVSGGYRVTAMAAETPRFSAVSCKLACFLYYTSLWARIPISSSFVRPGSWLVF